MKISQFLVNLGFTLVNWQFSQLLVNSSQLELKKINDSKGNGVDQKVNFNELTVLLTYPPYGGSQLVNFFFIPQELWLKKKIYRCNKSCRMELAMFMVRMRNPGA